MFSVVTITLISIFITCLIGFITDTFTQEKTWQQVRQERKSSAKTWEQIREERRSK
jgi:uncharacterized membrane protein (DUF106 family)